jgi:hypothetical protein
MKSATVPKSKFSDLHLLGHLKGLAWLSAGQLKDLDDSMTARNVRHKGLFSRNTARLLSIPTSC